MKIGITIANLDEFDNKAKLYRNGIGQHIFMLYQYLQNKGALLN